MSLVDALQGALAAEHAAIWAYDVVGAQLAAAPAGPTMARALTQARATGAAHRSRRDALILRLADLGAQPVAAAADYALPFAVTGPPAAFRLAVHVEQGVAAAWRQVIGASSAAEARRNALAALTDAAVRAARWRQLANPAGAWTVAFPGAS